jgi:2-isopropylmalate synthase
MGLGERNGLAATEQVLAALAYRPESLGDRLPTVANLWQTVPNLRAITAIARYVSEATAVPLKVSDPIVGTGMNIQSTGTAFVAPHLFQPFDPEVVLGVRPQLMLTQLASHRLVTAYAAERGYRLTPQQADIALTWLKAYAFRRGSAVIPADAFISFLAGLCALDSAAHITGLSVAAGV